MIKPNPSDTNILLPHNWAARLHQRPFMRYMLNGGKRAVCVWHRRAGKDSSSLNFTAAEAHRKVATYWHCLPTQTQARKVVWDAINPHTGVKIIDQVWPEELRKSTNNTEMKIELKCGSIWQCVGSDTYDSLVGSNPYGVIFSEYSVSDPRAWDFVRPILRENGGWAIFIYTPRGKNHGYDLYEMARNNKDWFCELLTVDNTKREDGTHIITPEGIQEELDAGMDPQLVQQEFYCSFDAGLVGAYYTDSMIRMEKEGRMGDYPWIQDEQVITVWDLGMGDDNFIIFAQQDGDYVRIIDEMYGNSVGMINWIKRVKEQPYIYRDHWAPHDIEVREYSTGRTRLETASSLGINFDIVPSIPLQDGIDASRAFLNRVRINKTKCPRLIDSLYNYRREYDDKNKIYKERPNHDWASHGADDFRYLSVSWINVLSTSSFNLRGSRRRLPKVITSLKGKNNGSRRR